MVARSFGKTGASADFQITFALTGVDFRLDVDRGSVSNALLRRDGVLTMILKCIDGPLDGAVYVLSKNTSDPAERSTNRKPDGLWFDGQDEHGRNVQHQYKFDKNSEHGTHVALAYKYDGQVVETGIEFETGESA